MRFPPGKPSSRGQQNRLWITHFLDPLGTMACVDR